MDKIAQARSLGSFLLQFGAHTGWTKLLGNMALRFFEEKDHAAAYLKYRPSPSEIIIKIMQFVEKKTPEKMDLAVDVGCGSGQTTILLAPYFKEVVGLDVSPAQLEFAEVNEKPPNVSYRQSTAEHLPFASGEVDLVTATTAAHWFDRQAFLNEADRVLSPGGFLALLSSDFDMELEYGDVNDQLNDICKEYYAALERHPHLGPSCCQTYHDMFDSCTYPDKEWVGSFRVRKKMKLSVFLGMMKTTGLYKIFEKKDPVQAEIFTDHIMNKMLSVMKVSSPDTEVTMVDPYFYWMARKPSTVGLHNFSKS